MTVLTLELLKVHDRYQTTVPSGMCKQLTLGKGDPALGAILGLIEADITAHPKRLRTFDCALHGKRLVSPALPLRSMVC